MEGLGTKDNILNIDFKLCFNKSIVISAYQRKQRKQSIYNLRTSCYNSDYTILFNTLYGCTAIINRNDLPSVLKFLDKPNAQCAQKGYYILNSLIKGKFLIEDNIDEIKIVRNRKLAGMEDKNRLDIIIMPNLDCNFICPYCYELHIPKAKMYLRIEKALFLASGFVLS